MDVRFIQVQGPPRTRGRLIGETARQRILQVLAAQERADHGKDGKTLHEWGPHDLSSGRRGDVHRIRERLHESVPPLHLYRCTSLIR